MKGLVLELNEGQFLQQGRGIMPSRTRQRARVSGENRALRIIAQGQGGDRGRIMQGLQVTLRFLIPILEQWDYIDQGQHSAVEVRALTRRWHFKVLLIISNLMKTCSLLTVTEQGVVVWQAHGMGATVHSALIHFPWTPPPVN